MRSKALLLLFIFLLNTVTGFACALHMSVHEHDEAAMHHHEGDNATEHHHEEHRHTTKLSVHQQSLLNGTYIVDKDDPCCQRAVNNFNTLTKVAPQANQVILLAPFTYIVTYYQFFLKQVSDSQITEWASLNERRRPPAHPIRITIQSFQI